MLPFLAVALVICSLVHAGPMIQTITNIARDVVPTGDPVLVDPIGEYMRTTVLSDGSILGGYVALDGTDANLQVVKSSDGGNSWTYVSTVDGGPIASKEMNNAFPLALADGRILYAYRNHDKIEGGGFSAYRITLAESQDGGASWSLLSQIDERVPDGLNGLWEPFLRIAGDGAIQAFYSAENDETDQDNLMRYSNDGGMTWSDIINVSGGDVTSRDGMTGIADIGDGRLMFVDLFQHFQNVTDIDRCVFENTETGPYSINAVFSEDDGYSWGGRTRVQTAADDHQLGAPQVINVGGTLVVSYMTDEAGNGPGADNGEMRVVTSGDGAATWSGAWTISGLGSHWPGLHPLDDTNFLALVRQNDLGLVTQKISL